MLQRFMPLLAVAAMAGLAAVPTLAQAQGARSDTTSTKSEAASGTAKSKAGNDEFEENRRAHMQKSKENNAKKGAE